MANARTEIKVRLKKIEIPLGILWFSNQDEIGYKAKAKKTPQRNGTKINAPSLATKEPKTSIKRK